MTTGTDDKVVGTVYVTKDYTKFRRHPSNRRIQSSISRKVRKGLARWGGWDPCRPCICIRGKGDLLYIVDGQHRFDEARLKKWEIPYIISTNKKASPDEYNRFSTDWKPMDYLEQGGKDGNKEYKKVYNFVQRYSLTPSFALCLLSGRVHYPTNLMKELKEGVLRPFTPLQWRKAEEAALYTSQVKDLLFGSMNRNLSLAIYRLYLMDQVNNIVLMGQIRLHGALLLIGLSSMSIYIDILDKIYNKGRKGERVQIKTLIKKATVKKKTTIVRRKTK